MLCMILNVSKLVIISIIFAINIKCSHNEKYAIAEEEIFIMEKPNRFDCKLVENKIIDTFKINDTIVIIDSTYSKDDKIYKVKNNTKNGCIFVGDEFRIL